MYIGELGKLVYIDELGQHSASVYLCQLDELGELAYIVILCALMILNGSECKMKGRTDDSCNPTFLVKCFTDKKSVGYIRLQFYTVENAVTVKAMDVLVTALMVVTVKSEDVIGR